MKKFSIHIVGETALTYDRFKPDFNQDFQRVKSDEQEQWINDNWWRKAELKQIKKTLKDNMEQDVFIPNEWFKELLINAAKKTGLRPSFSTKKNCTYTDYVSNVMFLIDKPICKVKDLVKYSCYNVKVSGKQRIRIFGAYAQLEKWETKNIILCDPGGKMKASEIEFLFEHAGGFIGIGAKRYFGFGRFKVKGVKEID